MIKPKSKEQEQLFYRFIESADRTPEEATIFPFFEFMDQSIRKNFRQLKKIEKIEKECESFQQFWEELQNQSKVNLYCNWSILLRQALELEEDPRKKLSPESLTLQDQIYVKKNSALFNKWEKKIAKLTPTHLHIIGKSDKEYELKYYQVRKSKSKDMFTFVLQPVLKNGKNVYCGFSVQNMFEQWFFALTCNINCQRIYYFLGLIKQERMKPTNKKRKSTHLKVRKQERGRGVSSNSQHKNIDHSKTQTEIMIEKQMKSIDMDHFSDDEDGDRDEKGDKEGKVGQMESRQKEEERSQHYEKGVLSKIEEQKDYNPNIFKKIVPEYENLLNFADTPVNSSLLHCDQEYRVYELPCKDQQDFKLKFFAVLPYPKALIFQAIVSETMGWNDDLDMLTIKTKISSQNTVLFYEKNKPQGILYRERDFLYLRHCFTVSEMKQRNTFIIDKSIDSIHQPPFMTVVRAEKQLLWGLVEKENGKQCILIVEGWIKGGGYMSQIQNKQMTLKFFKKLLNLKGFAKQLSFSETNREGQIFKQHWEVQFNREESQSESYPKKRTSSFQEQKNRSQISSQYEEMEKRRDSQDVKVEDNEKNVERENYLRDQEKEELELAEFMKRTSEEKAELQKNEKSEVMISEDKMGSDNYIPPAFDEKKFVKIPQEYLKAKHALTPKQKPKKPKLFPHYRGHHLWKGEWDILASGGLGYIDAEKMKEQKKVLTYIIKRIGKNIFSGKGILNISLPVDIFCVESNIERLAMSFGFFPHYLEKAAQVKDEAIQMKYVVSSGIASSLIYMTMEKPFNPILGETYQCWVDGCPIYFQQICHHPPIAAFMMKGRGYTISGCVEAKMDLSINSGTGNNEGIFTVQFENGNKIYYTTPTGCLTGLTYGDRKLNMIGKSFYWTGNGHFLQISYGSKNKGFFGGSKGQGDQKLPDYIEGTLKRYNINDLKDIAFRKENQSKPIIPKNSPTAEPEQVYYKVHGRWNNYVMIDGEKMFDVNQSRYHAIRDEKFPLPSHSNFREDIVYRRLRNFVVSQDFKEELEIKQREDRKLRAKLGRKVTE